MTPRTPILSTISALTRASTPPPIHPSSHRATALPWAQSFWRVAVVAATLVLARPAQAGEDDWLRWLPAPAQAQQALRESVIAQQAQARRQTQQARADAIAAGSAEFSVRTAQQQRRLPLSQERFSETSVALERPIRAWGKAGLDAALAERTREVAEIEQADALHEASRALIEAWFAHWQALGDLRLSQQQWRWAEQLTRQAQARARLGEVSRLDLSLAQADLQRAQAQVLQAQARLTQVRAQLSALYPSLPWHEDWPKEGDLPPLNDLARWRAHYLSHHHELRLMQAQWRQLQQQAERWDRERWPDPTVGWFNLRERDGSERITGVSVSVALPGAARQAQAQAAYAEALAAEHRWRLAEQQLGAQFDGLVATLQANVQASQNLSEAAQAQSDAAEKAAKAYALGEGSMTDLIQIQRVAAEQRRDAQRMQLTALAQWASFQLDLHLLWDLDEL